MQIFMVGEAANHASKLAPHLPEDHEIVALPREAASSAEFDGAISPGDAVISLRFSRNGTKAPPFRLLHIPGAGADGIDFAALSASTTVCNVFEHEIPIAEFVLSSMLNWEIRTEELRRSFSPEGWADAYRNRIAHGELNGKTLGLIGFGRIGRAIAARARAFGMRIAALVRTDRDGSGLADELIPARELPRLLAVADHLVLACPLTPETRGLIGRDELRAMKPGAFLINVSRAEIVDEAALFEALQTKAIAGAALDVWYRYPAGANDRPEPSRFPFHALENAICTPHSSAWTDRLMERRYAVIAQNLVRLARGEPLQNVIHGPERQAVRTIEKV